MRRIWRQSRRGIVPLHMSLLAVAVAVVIVCAWMIRLIAHCRVGRRRWAVGLIVARGHAIPIDRRPGLSTWSWRPICAISVWSIIIRRSPLQSTSVGTIT